MNATIQESIERVEDIQELCVKNGKKIGDLYFHGIWESLR